MRLREKLEQFMYGRYGIDGLGKALLWASMVLVVISMFLPTRIPYAMAIVLIVCYCFRMFSKNVQKRYAENCAYYRQLNKIKGFFVRQRSYIRQRKTHHIYKCPNCRQKIRIPKGKGKVMICCPKCHTEFMKNSR